MHSLGQGQIKVQDYSDILPMLQDDYPRVASAQLQGYLCKIWASSQSGGPIHGHACSNAAAD